jgi:hypothetical protein
MHYENKQPMMLGSPSASPDHFKRSLTVVKGSGSAPFDPKTLLSVVRDGTSKE